jgi:predicted phosphodiesterase
VDIIAHSGDVFEGEGAYPGQERELLFHGADEQRNYGLGIWPKSKTVTVLVRGTSHELAFFKKCGHDIVDAFVKMAPLHGLYNLKYLGDHKGIVEKNGIKIELVHPKGGIPYGVTYKLQKRIEHLVEIASSSDAKIMLCGHLHVAATMIYKGMVAFLVPCLEDQTEYLSEKDLIPYIGMWIFEVFCDELDNVTRLVSKYIPFEPKNKEKILTL